MAMAALVLGFNACVPNRPPPPPPAPAPVWQPEPEELNESPELLEVEITAPRRDILGDVAYDLPVEANSWVEAELDFLVQERRDVIARWLERGSFYEEFIKAELRRQGVPTDLFHLAMIESGFIPTARSRAGAVGFWQFMPATARAMGLRIDASVDERMDPVRSTRAAARHLRDLQRSMGNWALAAAAYNAGPGRINRSLQAHDAKDFWELAERGDLAAETKHYVPRLYAMTVIAHRSAEFGFDTSRSESFAFDSVYVEYATPLTVLADIGGVKLADLQKLNPHLIRGITPAGYWVWVPSSRGPEIQRAYLASDFHRERGFATYVVRRGDYLGRIAERSGVKMARIRELNPDVDFEPLQIGEKLRLPYTALQRLEESNRAAAERLAASEAPRASRASGSADAPKASSASASEGRAYASATTRVHRVRSGETLWAIARANDTTVEAIQEANGLTSATIRPGMELKLPDGGSAEVGEEAPKAVEHVVAAGDTLWGIARKYGSTVAAIEEANQLGKRPIRPGQRLRVPLGPDSGEGG